MQLAMDVDGFAGTTRLFSEMQRRGRSLYPVLRQVADDFLEMEREQFRSEGARAAIWKPLSAATVRQRGTAHPILNETSALRDSLTIEGARNAVRVITATSLLAGTDDPKATYHQTGTRNMVERRVIDVLPSDRDRWADMIARYLAP